MEEVLMTPEVCMQFLVWSYYYHDIMPMPKVSYKACGKFTANDAQRLDELKDTLFRCFEMESVKNACQKFQMAKAQHEPCPFTQEALDAMFAKEIMS